VDRKPEENEVATKWVSVWDRWRQMAVEMKTVGLISASSRPDEENTLMPNFPAPDDCRPDKACEKSELSAKLTVAIGTLPERYQEG
jgi:DNA-directed RNA polymerase specialized sigma subunit